MFQFFLPGFPTPTAPAYVIAGYGATSHNGTDHGRLRAAVMPLVSAGFVSPFPAIFDRFNLNLGWSNDSPRPCRGDVGSPLVVSIASRLLYTGIHQVLSSCDPPSGTALYSALSDSAAAVVLQSILTTRNERNLGFDCAVGADAASGLALFHCDNDGSVW
jgi:hypothetical protein